jgi:hypothetical protein
MRTRPNPLLFGRAKGGAVAGDRDGTVLRTRLLALLALEVVGGFAAVAATGSVHNTAFRVAGSVLALTLAVAILAGVAVAYRRPRRVGATAATPTRSGRGLGKTKVALLFLMAIGFATYFGGGGTFSNFSAETTNPNSQVASGTLTMSDQVNNNANVCYSMNGQSHNNVNSGSGSGANVPCDAAFTLTSTSTNNVAPGVFGGTAQIAIENTGSLPASKFYVFAPYVNGNTNASIATGAVASISVLNLEGPISGGDALTVAYGSQSISLTVTGGPYAPPANPGTTAVTVNVSGSNTTGSAIPSGATVTDTSSDTGATNTDCYDQKTTAAPSQVSGATYGTQLNFNSTTNNPMCGTTQLFIQEVGTSKNYCWFGVIDGASNAAANGMCAAPISANPVLSGVLSGGTVAASGTLTFGNGLRGNIKNGDTLLITEGDNQVQCSASANAFITNTSVTVGSCSLVAGANSGFDTNAVVTDSSTLSLLNPGSATATLTSFDTAHNPAPASKIVLYPTTGNGTIDTANPVQLPAYDNTSHTSKRTFYVGVYLPAGTSNQNTLQGLMSTFGISWHLDQ